MERDDQAAVETIVLAIEIEGPGRAPALFDDFSTSVGDRWLSARLDEVRDGGRCICGRRGANAMEALFPPSAGSAEVREAGHICQIIPFRGPRARRGTKA